MNKLVIFFAVVAAVCAAPVDDEHAEVLRSEADVHPEGYSFTYETSNGVKAEEQGNLQGEAIVAQGSFQYTAPDGTPVQVTYVADENGFQPQGSHLPTPPPTPDHVLKSLQYLEAHPPPPARP
ncbi:larval cuticle protein LCP-17-like [Ctenocephalides felis]|uniref:larval cuticle protein LCP-17-like n=1 Tax=Ctenocephalides felis TaxID=7515 RepID=UPI000E6E290D|nr:larval cuticle protein LCP-17-like [Ctenocephalides felis]